MKTKTFIIATLLATTIASQAAVILHGPADYSVGELANVFVDTITSAELNTDDQIIMTFSAANNDKEGWITVDVNGGGGWASFNSLSTVGGFLTRMKTTGIDPHPLYESGSIVDTDAAANFTLGDGLSHAVRITLFGFSDGNGFTGTHTALWEVDHFATSFSTADASMTAVLDFGGTDNGLELYMSNAFGTMEVSNFLVRQVPEPSSTALLGLGGVALMLRRRRK